MKRLSLLISLPAVAAMLCVAVPASAQSQEKTRQVRIDPYIDASQVFIADLQGGDVLTYSTLGAGVDATVQTRRVEVQLSYRYERRFDYQGDLDRNDTHSGLFRGKTVLARGLTLEGGAIATRTRSDIRGDALLTDQGNIRNSAQVFSGFIGPNLSTNVGQLTANAAYRFGYTSVGSSVRGGLPAGIPLLDRYDDSRVHVATASIGAKAGALLPIGITASGSFTREDAGQLDQRFEGQYGRLDGVLPVSRELAVVAGLGYESIQVTQRDPLRDGANVPIVDEDGRFVTDPASPRRIAYDLDGIFWDAGVIWKPSRRTYLEARVGRRYESFSFTGQLSYQISASSGVQINVYDTVQTFGQQLNGSLAMMPTSFVPNGPGMGNPYGGCIFGTAGGAAGDCLNGVFASAVTSAYRARGVTGTAVFGRGNTRFGFGGGYSHRTFLSPNSGAGFSVNGLSDESLFAQIFGSTQLSREGSLTGSLYGSYFSSDFAPDGVFGWGANSTYAHQFGPLGATVSAGLYGFDNQIAGSSTLAQLLFGLRYGF